MRRLRSRIERPSPAMIVALLALFVALSASGVAAVTLSKNSVSSKHIRNGQVMTADLGSNAVTSAKVKDGSLLTKDFKAGQIPPGPRGPAGPQGAPGAPGEPGRDGDVGPSGATYVSVYSETLQSNLGETIEKTVSCEYEDEAASGGGYETLHPGFVILDSAPTGVGPMGSPTGWRVKVYNDYADNQYFPVYVVCVA